MSAAPHPLATVRPNESAARAAGAVTVTDFVAVSVAPLSSVTVSFTVYVPADPYVWLGLTPLPGEESPKSHAYDATVPSASADADASNATARSVGVAVNDAVGGLFAGGAVTVTDFVACPSHPCRRSPSASPCTCPRTRTCGSA